MPCDVTIRSINRELLIFGLSKIANTTMSNPTNAGKPKRRIVSGWDKFWIFVVVLIFIFVILEKLGIHLVKTTDDTEVVHPTRRY